MGTLGSQSHRGENVGSRVGAAFPMLTNLNKALTHGGLGEAGWGTGVGAGAGGSRPGVCSSSASPCCVTQGRPLALSEA